MKIDVKGKVESAYLEAPFDEAKNELESNKYRIISLEENANLRIQEGKDAFISRNGNWTREGVIYLPSNKIYLTKNSPIMADAKKATDCHRKGSEFYINEKQIEEAKKDAVKFTKKDNYSIPTDKFGDDEITAFAFGKIAKDYGNFLKDAGIKEMPVYLANCEKKPFARQMWFRGLGDNSELGGSGRLLDCSCRARGVREVSAEGAAQKIQTYTLNDISKALKEANLSGIEKVLLEKLKK